MKIILSGGGTGGHIYPAVTIADYLKKINPEAEITFVGTREGLEKDIVPRYGYPLEFIEVAGFKRKLSWDTVASCGKLLVGLNEARTLLNKIKPDLVIGTGGYVCGPILLWAALQGIPTCIQEQNAMPGVTNKILAHFVKKVFLGYAEGAKFFGGKAEKIVTGNPIRKEILAADRATGLAKWKLSPQKTTLLVAGGSRGAQSINNAMALVVTALAGRSDVQVLVATGEVGYRDFTKKVEKKVLLSDNIKVFPYLHEMPLALAVADLAVFRAGAVGLAELMAKGIPSILIPYPYATANHQEYNARAIERAGAATVILDQQLTGSVLLARIEELLQKKDKLQTMQAAAQALGKPEAGANIARQALALIKGDKGEVLRC
ncbi:MAG: undecaprenyldiphospho-muramoylpentapeptide beta-N-acetylglucosaminyltransferase [Acidaminococcaceae bacterium]